MIKRSLKKKKKMFESKIGNMEGLMSVFERVMKERNEV